MRINAYLAQAGVASRRGADDLIKAGKVKINGQAARLNSQVEVKDKVELDGQPVGAFSHRYILLYKPTTCVTTLDDPQGRKTVMDYIKVPERLVPVGRLDYDTTGVLLLTNDGDTAHRLMHPSFLVDKVYQAGVKGNITPKILNLLSIGVDVEGKQTAPALAKKLDDSVVELTVHEGRKHQVKVMLAAVGLPVTKLHRSKYAGLDLQGLKPGQWRDLTNAEVAKLKSKK